MKKLYSLLLGTLLCITGGHLFGNSWLQRSSLPADARLAPMSFGLNGKVFLVGGQHQVAGSDYDLADCWAYDPTTDTWSQQADYGGGLISRGVAFTIGSLGYVGCGTVFPAGQLWAYDPAANQWTPKASAPIATPTAVRILSAAFTVAGKAYVCGGLDTAIRSDLWEYDPVTDTWTQRTSFPGGGRYGAIAFSANGKGYFGTGTNGANEQQDMWAYDPQDDTWIQLGNFPGAVRTNAAAFSIGTRGFVHGGVDVGVASYNDLWEFNTLNGTWTQRASNVTRYLATATSLGNKGYFGMGNFGPNFNDWWEYTPDPQLDCLGVPNGTALPGTSCDDGNASTTNDVFGSNCICAGTPSTNSWVQRADFGGGQRGGGFSFALAGKGFVGGGSNSGGATFNDTWTYDPATNAWNQMASLPVTGATGGLGFSIGGTGYVYVTEVNALWAYDPNTNSWNERAAFPGDPRFRPFGFALGAYGYMGGGFSYGPMASMNDFWRYDPSSDSWLQRADLSGVARSGSASFTVDGLGYVFGGADDAFNVLGDLQAYDPVANTWNSRASLPSIGRRGATGFSIGHAGYVAGGSTSSFIRLNECWEYQPGNNLWNEVAAPGPEGREVGMAFTIGMQGYLVGGYAGGANTTIADLRMYTQNPQPDCNGVVGGTNYPGTPCNDGNATTTNDVFDANCICAGIPSTNSWVQRSDFGGGGRAQPFSFTLNEIGYLGGGFFSPFGLDISDDVWAYDPSIDAWSQVADFGGGVNAASATFVVNGKGYVVGGLNNGGEVNELWAYDPMLNTWIPRAPIPNSARRRPIAFALNGLGFAGTGLFGSTTLDDFWAYDPVSDTWSPRANAPAPSRWFATSFTVDGIGYLCGGADETFNDPTDLHAYDPLTNSWTSRASYPGAARRAAIGFSIGHAGYVACGLGALERFNDCYEYRPGLDSWIQVTAPGPQPRSSAAAFTIADKAFLVGGYSGDPVATIADMRMYTQNAQPDCNGVIGGTNYPGSPCDDGLAYTGNDALNGLCMCQGTCVNDADGDGICDEVDNCPLLPGVSGTPCDDGNPCTLDDQLYLVFGGNCNCTGYYADSDNDGVCDAQDNCPTLTGQQGDTCDDGDANTTNDVITSACICAGTQVSSDAWTQQAAFSGFPRANAVSFTIGNYGYMGTGEDGATLFQDLWRYDPVSDSWSQMADIDVPRTGAYAFAIGDFGYVGDGNDQNALHIADLRRYDPASNSWAWLWSSGASGFPGRYRGVAFSANGKGYVGTGQTEFANVQDFHEFDPTTNGWTQLADFPGDPRALATAFSIGNKGYVGTGASGPGVLLNDFYEFDAVSLTWSPRSNFGGTPRATSVGFSLNGKGYLGTGQDASGTLQDFWEYDPTADTWTLRTPLPGVDRSAAVAFALNDKGYVATGGNVNGVLGDVWEYTPDGVTCTVGDPCDDGLAYTQNDTLTTNCGCAGVCISDLDLDGLCDEADPCPYQSLPVGSACDDFNACTENDVVQPWCGCAGTPLPDGDSDGICDLLDQCPSSPGSIGFACDDGNPCTANDVIDANCVCAGQIPDANNDGLSDLCNPYVIQTVTNGCSTYMLLSRSNWTNAEAAAVSLGGHLVTINNAAEDAFIYNTFTQSGPVERGLWIGFNDLATEDEFVWSSGEASTYTNWTPGEPSNLSGERYAGIFWPSEPRAPQWFDETNGFLPYGFDVGVYMYGVVEIPADDSDNDGICDAQDSCPNEAPGAGDVFATAVDITVSTGAIGDATCYSNAYTATSTPGDASASGDHDVFYTYTTGVCATTLDVELCGGDVVHLLDASGAHLASGDATLPGFCGAITTGSSLIAFGVVPNTLYYVVVEADAEFVVSVEENGGADDSDNDGICDAQDSCPTQAPGAGDLFATAVDITTSGDAVGDATCYSNAYTGSSTPGDVNASDDHDVFYTYTTGVCATTLDVELCGGDVVHLLDASGAHLASGDATLPGFCGAITTGSSLIAFGVAPNTLYYVVVEADAEFVVSVEENGGADDSDNDGICDAQDDCPNEAPGAGDVFATAVDITVSTGAIGDATCYSNAYTATSTPGDASASDDHDVFYTYTTGVCATTLDVELCGGDVVHLLSASGAHLASGDATLPAFCGSLTTGSSLSAFGVAPNTLYYVVVEADGEFVVSVEENGGADDSDNDGICDAQDSCPTQAPGAGDLFATAVDITTSGDAVGDATCYSNAYTGSSTPGDVNASDDHDVFYTYTTGVCATTLDVELCGGDVVHLLDASGAHLASGDATLPGFCGAITTGSSLIAFGVAPNTLYYVVVEADAEFVVSVEENGGADDSDNDGICDAQDDCPNEAPGAGDVFATAVDITVSTGAIGDATCYSNAYTATSTPGDASASDDHDVFYTYTTGVCATTLDVELCGGDVVHLLDASGAHLASGDATLPGFCGAITTGSSLIAFGVAPNTLYYVVVEADAEFVVSVEENGGADDSDNDGICDAQDDCPNEAPGAGDVFATAVDITVSTGAIGDATCYSNAYTSSSTPGDGNASDDHDVFYTYTTGVCATTLDVELCGGDVVHLLDGSGAHLASGDATLPGFCGAITTGSSLIAFGVAPNTLYYVVVEADGEFVVSVEENGGADDSDNDGICDAQDDCPNEAPGAGDVFATAVDITVSTGAIGDATCYSNAYTSSSTPGDGNASDDHDVFYTYTTGVCATTLDVELCGGDVVHLLDGSGAHLASGDATLPGFCGAITTGSSLIAFGVAPNTLYYVVVEADGEFVVSVEENGGADDSDNDGICDAQDNCPNIQGQIGSSCNDGNPCTINDMISAFCVCAGASGPDSDGDGVCDAIDTCPNVAGQVGSPCNDQSPCTTGDVLNANCQCVGTPVPDGTMCDLNAQCIAGACTPIGTDSDGDGIPDATDNCPTVPGQIGSPCTDNNPATLNDILNANCLCQGSPATQITLVLRTDAFPEQTSWDLIDAVTNAVVHHGDGYNANVTTGITLVVAQGCYILRVNDSAGDGIVGGGYVLFNNDQAERIIDNAGNFGTGATSQIANSGTFCVPLGYDRAAFTSCDKLDWTSGQYVVAAPNGAVSAEWIVGGSNAVQDANSGYEFWIFDPNGSYSFRRFRSHNQSDGFGPASAIRACHMKLNNWAAASHVPANTLMNVRVRARINGVNGAFGPACRLEVNPALAACPQTQLLNIPGDPDFSCGATRMWGTGNLVHARPVSGANRYQFRFRIAAEGFEVVRTANTYFTQLNWITLPLQNGKTYDVDVRVSKNSGATWCSTSDPWGPVCQLTIDNTPANSGNQNFAGISEAAELRIFPNPNRGDVLNFSISAIEEGVNTVSVDIYDLTGKRMSARTIAVADGNVNTVIDLNGELAAGMYLVNITAGENTYTERLVIQP